MSLSSPVISNSVPSLAVAQHVESTACVFALQYGLLPHAVGWTLVWCAAEAC